MTDHTATIDAFLTAAAARQPAPGGGSVTALVGALAATMGEMTVNYSVGRKGLEAHQDDLRAALAELDRARGVLVGLMTEDQLAYEALTAVRKLPADAPERLDRMPAVLLACVRVPEAMAATAVAILGVADRLVDKVNPWLLSDLAVCADLAMTTTRCAAYNVRANLADVTDPADRWSIEATIDGLLSRALATVQRVSPRIWARVAATR